MVAVGMEVVTEVFMKVSMEVPMEPAVEGAVESHFKSRKCRKCSHRNVIEHSRTSFSVEVGMPQPF